MAITIPNSFTAGTTIVSAQVNENFDEIAEKALDKTGDTITGNITVSSGVTIDGVDISAYLDQAVKTTSSPTFADLTVSGTLTLDSAVLAADGVTFPATAVASGDANTLDDYQEENWTPAVTFGGGSTGITYGTQVGRAVKLGQLVFASFDIVLTSKGSSTGAAVIGGLPYAALVAHGVGPFLFENLNQTRTVVMALTTASATTLTLYNINAFSSMVAMVDTDFANTTRLTGTVIYRASA